MPRNTIEGSFGMNINPLRVAANRALGIGQRLGRNFSSAVSGPLARLGATIGTVIGGAAFARGVKGAYDFGDALTEMRGRTSIAIRDLVILRQQLADNGVEAGSLGQIINKLQDSLGKKEGARTLGLLHLQLSQVRKLGAAQQFVTIGKALNRIEDPAKRAQYAIDLFGRAAGQLLTVFADPSFGMGGSALQQQAENLSRNAEIFGEISDRLGRVGNVLRGFFIGVADRVSSVLLPMLVKLESLDLVAMGQKFGEALASGAKAIAGALANPGQLFGIFFAYAKAGTAEWMNKLLGSLLKAAVVFGEGMKLAFSAGSMLARFLGGAATSFAGDLLAALSRVGSFLHAATSFAFQKAAEVLDGALRPITANLQAGLQFAIEKVMQQIGRIPVVGKKLGLEGFKAQSFRQIRAERTDDLPAQFKAKSLGDIYNADQSGSFFARMAKSMQSSGGGIMAGAGLDMAGLGKALEAFRSGSSAVMGKNTRDFFGAGAMRNEAAGLFAALKESGARSLGVAAPAGTTAASSSSLRTGGLASSGLMTGTVQSSKATADNTAGMLSLLQSWDN